MTARKSSAVSKIPPITAAKKIAAWRERSPLSFFKVVNAF